MVFRLQIAGNMHDLLLSHKAQLPSGREHGSRSFVNITEGLTGTFEPDAGYLLREETVKKMFDFKEERRTPQRKKI